MADDNNPLADIYNAAALPYMLGPNKYSAFNGNPLSLQGYAGTPTDARGQPIQSFVNAQQQHDAWSAANPAPAPAQGTTLNSLPAPAMTAQGFNLMNPGAQQTAWDAMTPSERNTLTAASSAAAGGNAPGAYYAPGSSSFGSNQYAQQPMVPFGQTQPFSQQQTQGAAQPAAPQNPVDMRQAYLSALSNPGPVTTPGANAPQSAPAGQQPNVLDSFLAHNAQPQAPGAGGYSNAGFFNTLRGLRAGASP